MDNSASEMVKIPLNQCRKVYVQRDYSHGLNIRFQTTFPTELHGKVNLVWLFPNNILIRFTKATVESSLFFIMIILFQQTMPILKLFLMFR